MNIESVIEGCLQLVQAYNYNYISRLIPKPKNKIISWKAPVGPLSLADLWAASGNTIILLIYLFSSVLWSD